MFNSVLNTSFLSRLQKYYPILNYYFNQRQNIRNNAKESNELQRYSKALISDFEYYLVGIGYTLSTGY